MNKRFQLPCIRFEIVRIKSISRYQCILFFLATHFVKSKSYLLIVKCYIFMKNNTLYQKIKSFLKLNKIIKPNKFGALNKAPNFSWVGPWISQAI